MAKRKQEDKTTTVGGCLSGIELAKKIASKYGHIRVEDEGVPKGVSTGLIVFDKYFGTVGGGFPIGRMTELYGNESSGKSLLGYLAGAEMQRRGGLFILIDAERSYIQDRAASLGVDISNILIYQPDNLNEAFKQVYDVVETIRDNDPDQEVFILFDSLAALTTEDHAEKAVGAANMGTEARLLSGEYKKLIPMIKNQKVALVVINQIRSKIGVMFGQDWDTTGGNATKFYASVRLHLLNSKKIVDEDKNIVGITGAVEFTKNRISRPFTRAPFNLYFDDSSIDVLAGLFDYCTHNKVLSPAISKSSGKEWAGHFVVDGFPDLDITRNSFDGMINSMPEFKEFILSQVG
jgi:protein RecA